MPVRVVVYEDNDDLRDSLVQTLKTDDTIDCCASYPNCEFVKEQMEVWRQCVILMDIDMPIVNGLEGVKIIRHNFPEIQVIMLTVFENDENIFTAICNGASGYLLKKTPPQKIIE